MNTQTTTQINQILPVFFSISLIFFKLFCNSPLPLSIQQVCSASTFSIILLYFNLLCYSALIFISLCTYAQFHIAHTLLFPFLLVSFFFLQNSQPSQSVSFSFMHTSPTVPLRLPSAKTRTPVLATETLTDS
jgi:hypothetical protein